MPDRYPLHQPNEQPPGNMIGAWAVILAAAAFDIGTRVEALLNAKFGPAWAPLLEDFRRKTEKAYRVNVLDPAWVFSEPNKERSPVPEFLPHGFSATFRKVHRRRNDWFHRNSPWSLDELEDSLDVLEDATRLMPELKVNQEIGKLRGHLFELRQARVLPSQSELDVRAVLSEERANLAEARQQQRHLQQQLSDALGQRGGDERLQELLAAQLAEQKRLAEEAERQARDLAKRLRKIEEDAATLADPDALLPLTMRPGDPWPEDVPVGRRTMNLLPAPMVGIFDRARGALVVDELGEVGRKAAQRWHKVMPLGGEIHVTDGWNTAGLVGGRMTYLGRLDEDAEQARIVGASVLDFLTPKSYLLTPQDVLDRRLGIPLTRSGAENSEAVIRRISAAIAQARAEELFTDDDLDAIEAGDVELRVSKGGHVVTSFGESRGYLTTVTANEWFPGHLRP